MSSFRNLLLYLLCHISNILSSVSYFLRKNSIWAKKLLLLSVLFSGCGIYRAPQPKVDYCYLNPHKDLYAVGRVAIVELNNDSSYSRASIDVTEALFQALQKKQIFSLNIVRQTDPAWKSLQFDLDAAYSLEQLFSVRKALRCDAMLIGAITGYRPYPHMVVGLCLKLVDLRDGQLLWAIEQVWDGADKTTAYRIKEYYRNKVSSNSDRLREQLVTISQLEFIKFIASETADTMLQNQ